MSHPALPPRIRTSKANPYTPGKKGVASQDKAHASTTRMGELTPYLTEDIEKAATCGFDDFLRAFIYKCLIDTSDIDALEQEIEQLEMDPEKDAKEVRDKRDRILDDHLRNCLEGVLDVANSGDMRELLTTYLKSLSSNDETDRYGPYANVCNAAFEKLSPLTFTGLRGVDNDDPLRCRRLDPLVFSTSCWSAIADTAFRKPDGGYAGARILKAIGEYLDAKPKVAGGNFPDMRAFDEWKRNLKPKVELPEKFTTERKCIVEYKDKNDPGATCEAPTVIASSPLENPFISPPEQSSNAPPAAQTSQSLGKRKSTTDGQQESRASKKTRTDSFPLQLPENRSQKSAKGRVQCAAYALEMLYQNMGLLHAINLLHLDDTLFIWYYDRQGILRSDGINVIQDFPRLLVLLLLFQRFTPANWGIVEEFNAPDAKLKVDGGAETKSLLLKLDSKTTFDRKWKKSTLKSEVTIGYGDKDYLSTKPRCLSGRATRVLKATGEYKDSKDEVSLAVKISYPEVRRCHEGEVIAGIRNIAESCDGESPDEAKIKHHLPDILFYGDVMKTGTRLIRSLVGVPTAGHRVMRVLVMNQLQPLHELEGFAFLEAWLDTLTCHAFLWKHGVEHGDPSLDNVMHDPATKRGVLTDFDLSIIQWTERIPGTDRTGTVPFMALDLLCKDYWSGNMVREYYHELEAFLWILLYVALDNADGADAKVLMGKWKTGDWEKCLPVKDGLLKGTAHLRRYKTSVPASFKRCFTIALGIFKKVKSDHDLRQQLLYAEEFDADDDDDDDEFESDFLKLQRQRARGTRRTADEWSQSLFNALVEILGDVALSTKDGGRFKSLVERLKKHQPSFQKMTDERKAQIKDIYGSPPQTQAGVQPRRSVRRTKKN